MKRKRAPATAALGALYEEGDEGLHGLSPLDRVLAGICHPGVQFGKCAGMLLLREGLEEVPPAPRGAPRKRFVDGGIDGLRIDL